MRGLRESRRDMLRTHSGTSTSLINGNTNAMNYVGNTPVVSFNPPTIPEIKDAEMLELYMRSREDIYDNESNIRRRTGIISKLSSIVQEWVIHMGTIKHMDPEYIHDGGGVQLKIFGSQKIGVQSPDSDIDVLCIAPNYISREEFFNVFCIHLSSHENVSMMFTIPEAYTPVAKFYLDGQAIDMIFVSLDLPRIPHDLDILDPKYLCGLDDAGIRSINGCRVAEKVLQLVPNVPTFCTALRAIKHWAKTRGLYSNVLGFLGGVNFAILVAFVCQRYVNANAATIVRKLFMIFSQWRWPNPVHLTQVEENIEIGGRCLPVWNPMYNPKDAAHRMPIITPAYPAMNSAYNVGLPQFRTLQEEIFRGQLIFQAFPTVTHLSNEGIGMQVWRELFASPCREFFSRYPLYVQIDISSTSPEEQRSWFGWCESRLRTFIVALEQPPMLYCHPQASCYHRQLSEPLPHNSDDANYSHDPGAHARYVSSFFLGLSFRDNMVDITPSIQEFLYRTNGWQGKQPSMLISINTRGPNEIPSFVQETTAEPSSTLRCTPSCTPLKPFLSDTPLSPSGAKTPITATLNSPIPSSQGSPFFRDIDSRVASNFHSPDIVNDLKFGSVDPSMLTAWHNGKTPNGYTAYSARQGVAEGIVLPPPLTSSTSVGVLNTTSGEQSPETPMKRKLSI